MDVADPTHTREPPEQPRTTMDRWRIRDIRPFPCRPVTADRQGKTGRTVMCCIFVDDMAKRRGRLRFKNFIAIEYQDPVRSRET